MKSAAGHAPCSTRPLQYASLLSSPSARALPPSPSVGPALGDLGDAAGGAAVVGAGALTATVGGREAEAEGERGEETVVGEARSKVRARGDGSSAKRLRTRQRQ